MDQARELRGRGGERRVGAGIGRAAPGERRPRKLNVPNVLTATRLGLLPVLWGLALFGSERALAIGLAVAASTDVLDGFIARAFHVKSELGSRLDSIADHALSASVLLWLIGLRPEFVARYLGWLIAWGGIAAVTLAVGWVRFRRIGDLHLYSAKLAMVAGYLFVVGLLYFDTYRPLHVGIVLGIAFVAVVESLLVYLTRRDPAERVGSILSRRAGGGAGGGGRGGGGR